LPDSLTLSRRETADILSEIKHLEQGYKKRLCHSAEHLCSTFFFLPYSVRVRQGPFVGARLERRSKASFSYQGLLKKCKVIF